MERSRFGRIGTSRRSELHIGEYTAARVLRRRGHASPKVETAKDADSDALKLNADAAVLAGTLSAGETARLTLPPGRGLYLVPASGTVTVNGTTVNARDGAAITGETEVVIAATSDAELVLVDVAA